MLRRRRTKRTIPPILPAAQGHRQHATAAEEVPGSAVRGQEIRGLPFRRQHPAGRFILDFCCPRKKLCVQLDGGIRDEQQGRDAARTEALARPRTRVIRFRDDGVLQDIASVVQRIEAARDPA